jgi:hypothetical protein
MEPEDKIERIIVAVIGYRAWGSPTGLTHAILEKLWEAGYDIVLRPETDSDAK